jgi:glutamyl-tRNA synthetase
VEEFLPNDITILPQYNPIRLKQILPILRERIQTFADITTMAEGGELEYFFEQPDYDAASLIWRQDTDHHGAEEYLAHSAEVLSTIPQADFKPEILKETLWHYASEKGRGSVLWPLRYALSGRDQSPDPFVLAASLGKEETLNRIKFAQEKLQTL